MKCRDILRLLGEYVDGEIDPALCQELEQHLTGCDPCQVVIENLRQTITIYREGEVYELPEDFSRRLHEALRARWRENRTA